MFYVLCSAFRVFNSTLFVFFVFDLLSIVLFQVLLAVSLYSGSAISISRIIKTNYISRILKPTLSILRYGNRDSRYKIYYYRKGYS